MLERESRETQTGLRNVEEKKGASVTRKKEIER